MGYLSFQIIVFLLLAALLGVIIGWLLRGTKFQSELNDLDARWRTKLGDVEGERDRFVAELNQSNDAKTKLEAQLLDARKSAEGHEGSLEQLRRDHQTKVAALADQEKLALSLQSDLKARDEDLAKAQAGLAQAQRSGGDSGRLGSELAAATERTATLESSLSEAKAANATCKSEVDRLKAQIAELQRSGSGGTAAASPVASGSGLGLMGSPDSAASTGSAGGAGTSDASGGTAGSGGGALGFVGSAGSSTGDSSGSAGSGGSVEQAGSSRPGSDHSQGAAGSSHLTASGGQPQADPGEGVKPTALAVPHGGQADDLKQISGVGPKLEKTLNGLGIFHFSQIAEFTPENAAWVDQHLRFKGRIARENWVEQAKILATGGETEFSRRQ
ncbi:MAG: hypothetical protein ACR2Q4_17590 [Geminicoccaceae bacterium]